MGLLDSFDMFPDDPRKQAMMAWGLGLLGNSGRGGKGFGGFLRDVGNSGQGAMQVFSQAQEQQRKSRAEELANIAPLYKIFKDQQNQDSINQALGLPASQPSQLDTLIRSHLDKITGLAQRGAPPSSPQALPASSPVAPPAQSASQPVNTYTPDFSGEKAYSVSSAPPVVTPQNVQAAVSTNPNILDMAGIPRQAAALWIASGKTEQLAGAINDAFKDKVSNGIAMGRNSQTGQMEFRGGMGAPGSFPVMPDKSGGLSVVPIKGMNEAAASLEAAKKGATAPYEFGSYPIGPNNASQVASIAELRRREDAMRGPQIPPEVLAADRAGKPFVASQAPGGPVQFGDIPRAGGLSGTDPVQVAAATKSAEALANFHANNFIDTQNAEKAARQSMARYQRINQLLDGVETGKTTPAGMTVAAYAKSLGMDVDPKLPNKQAAEALTGQIALELRNPSGGAGMPGALSDNDLKFLRSMTPGLAQTTEGRKMIMDTKMKLLQRDMDVGQLARDYRKQNNGRIDDGFTEYLAKWSDAHPMFPVSETKQPTIDDVAAEILRRKGK